jgi:hypothetical protein
MTTVLFTSEASIWDSILLWRKNIESSFSGVEPCPICYSIIHSNDFSKPNLTCRTCKNKFHSSNIIFYKIKFVYINGSILRVIIHVLYADLLVVFQIKN